MSGTGVAFADRPSAAPARRAAKYSAIPLRFEPNLGQSKKNVRFVGRAAGYRVGLEAQKVTFDLPTRNSQEGQVRDISISMSLIGSRKDPVITALGELPGKSNYLRTSDPRSWLTDVPNFSSVRYHGVYPRIDMVFHGNGNRLEYDFNVDAGGDPRRIAWRFGRDVAVDLHDGELLVHSDQFEFRFLKPVAYQQNKDGAREAVSSNYRLRRDTQGTVVSFAVGSYDRSRLLVIDPVLVYSTQLSSLYNLLAMTTDTAGNVYAATSSGALEVVKLAPDGQTLVYNSTIGTATASANSLAVDSSGQLYITGYAYPGYATTASAFQPTSGSGYHAFLTVLNASGSGLVYSSYLQGSNYDRGNGIALDPTGKALISGWTTSTDFPNTNNVTANSYQKAFVAKFDPTLSGNASLLYSALITSTSNTDAVAVHSDSSGNAYTAIQGYYLPTTAGAYRFDGINANYGGVYVAKVDANGATQFISYLGYGNVYDLTADGAGNSYVTGTVYSGDFSATIGAYQTSYPYGFLTKLNPSGTALVYSTFLSGPSGQITPTSVTIPAGCTSNCTPFVSGYTSASDLPTVNAIQNQLGGNDDAFIVNLTADGSAATFSTYLGGSSYESSYSNSDSHVPQVSLDGAGNIYLAGNTSSADFPFTNRGSGTYSYIAKISPTAGANVVPDKASIVFYSQTLNLASDPIALTLHNVGSAVANISSITSSDSAFTQTNNCGGSIPAGGTCVLQLVFTPAAAGLTSATLSIAHDGLNSPATVALSGNGYDQGYIRISPATTFLFGGQPVNTASAPQTLTITNVGSKSATLSVSVPFSDPEFAMTTNCPAVLAPAVSCSASVTFVPYNIGQFNSYISVNSSATVSPIYYLNLTGTGTGIGTSSLTPTTTILNFPDQQVGTSSSYEYVTFTNTGSIPVTVGPAVLSGDFTLYSDGCRGNVFQPGSGCTVYVQFVPTAAGTRTGTLTVQNTAGADQVVSLSGVGATGTPTLIFSPSAMVFADQVIGTQSSSSAIQVTNTGSTTVTISRVYDSGGDFRVISNGCSLLYPLGQCTVYVAFTPTTAGVINGSVTFVDTANGSPHVVTATGNGLVATSSVVPTPSTATFDDTVVGSSSYAQTFYLFNPGNASISASAALSSSADFVVTYDGCSSIPANYYCQLNVQFRPQSAGQITGTITINHSAPGSPTVINVSGTGLTPTEGLVASPLSAGFNDTVVGQISGVQAIYFYNPGNTNVTVSNVSVSGDFVLYSNGCSTAYAASYCYVYVQFAPTSAGTRNGTLTLFDDAPGSPHTVSLTGNGVNPVSSLVATPSSVGFDDQVVGTTSPATYVTMYNPGNVAVTISNVAVSGDFTVGSCGTISAKSYCSLPVTFTPTASGQRTGTITLTDSAAGSPHGISLYGNGLAATTTIAITPGSLDFGSIVTATSAPAQTVYINNTGTTNVSITSVVASSPFTASGCVTTLSPASYCAISVSLNPSATGPISGSLTITDSASGSPHTVTLAADGVSTTPAISMSVNGLTFPQTVVGVSSGNLGVNFVNHSGATIAIASVVANGDFAIVGNNCTSVANNGSCNVTVKFSPTAAGNRSGTLVYTHNGPGGSTSINLSGFGLASISTAQLSASALAFPDQVVGTSSGAQTVYLWNNGTTSLSVGTVSISGDFGIVTNACSTVGPRSYCYVNVKFQPSTPGALTGALTINASDGGSPHVVTLSGNGVAATKTLALSATAVQFNDQAVGYTGNVQTIYAYNTGNSPVGFTAPNITGDFAIQYNACPSSLGAGSSCYINVTFTPTASGSRNGTLTFNDDAAGAPHSLSLAGNGINATKTYALTVNSMGFSDQPLNTPSNTQYSVLYNTGTAPLVVSGTTVSGDYSLSYNGCYSQTVAVGSSCTVGILFQPTASGARTGDATIGTDSPSGAATIALTGNGVNPVKSARVSAASLSFADLSVGSTSSVQYVYVYNTGNVPLNISSVTFSGDYSTPYGVCNGSVSVGSYCYEYVVFTPTAAGTRTGSLTITDDSPTSPHVISLSGNGLTPSPRININPGNLVFPPTGTGSLSNYMQVVVTNVGNAPVQMNSATITGADFKIYSSGCDSQSLPVGSYACYVYVQFAPTTTGPLTGTLTLSDNASGNPHSIALSGTGIDPSTVVQLSQNSITFPNQPTNTTSPAATVYMINQGATPVTISTVVATGDFQVSGCANNTLYQTYSCYMYVTFKPTATGTRTGSVTVTDNATGSPRVISLSGNGVTPFPIATVSPNNLVFASQNVGSSSGNQTVTVYNTGSAPLNIASISSTVPDFATSSGCVGAVAANSYCQFNVHFVPQSTGTITGSIQIVDDASGSPHLVSLTGVGTAAGPIVGLSTNAYSFGNQPVDITSAPTTFTIYNNGNGTLNITGVATSGPFGLSSNTCSAVAPAGSCTVGVTFTPLVSGPISGALSITDNAPGTPHVIGLSGYGLSNPSLTITPSSLIFNSQQLNTTSAAQVVSLQNSGSTLTVSGISITAGAFAQTNGCTTIGTGGSCQVSVTFSPTVAGPQTATLTIVDDAPGSPHTVAISGTAVGQPAVSLSSTNLDFGSQNVGTTSATQSVTMTNTGAGPLAINSITASNDYTVTNNCGNNLSAGANCTLTIAFVPGGANTRTGTVSIVDNAPNTPQTIALTGIGNGAVASLSATSLDFGNQAVGVASAAQTFTLTNTGNIALSVSSISSTNPQYAQTNNCPASLAAAANCTISVTFTPTAAGTQGGAIYVSTSVGTPSASLTGSGTGPVGVVTPPSLSFGNVTVGTPSATQTVTLSSTGTTALSIAGISSSGDFSQTNNCPASLAVGSNCTIQVTFTPAAAGSRSGTLSISDSSSINGHSVPLIGTGLGALLTLNPSSLGFGTVALNTSATPQSITVTNSGTVLITGLTISAATGDYSQSNNCPSSLGVNATCTITVGFRPTVAGSRTGSLSVTSNAPTQSASFNGAGSGPLAQFNPTGLSFGSVVQNTISAPQSVVLTNAGNANLNISSIASSGDFAQTNNCPSALTATSICTISVIYTPTSLGSASGAVTVIDDAGGSPHQISLTGTGIVPQEDLVVTGAANPASIPPGGSTTFSFLVTNNGPSTATSVSFSATLPTSAQVNTAASSTGSCVIGATVTCSLANMPVNSTATVTITATSTALAPMSTTATITAAEPDPNTANNQQTVTATVAAADLTVSGSMLPGTNPSYVVTVTNSGPAAASNVIVSCAYDRYGYSSYSAPQGSCSYSGSSLNCSLGSIGAAGSASITQVILPPKTGWATIACHAQATEYDPNPVNNSAQLTPDGAVNTNVGDNVGVQLYDSRSGAAARVQFPSVKQSGATTLNVAAGAIPPAGFRNGSAAWTYDVSTTASFVGSPIVALGVVPAQFHHPDRVRLFHMEGGAWVDRTISSDQVTSTVAAIAPSLSPFALFEPVNHAPVANAGSDRLVAGTSVLGATVSLDGGSSSDADGDALTYRWSGLFAEGNGTAVGTRANVTLPFGTSRLTLVTNDGEADSAPVTFSVTVTDFGVAAGNTNLSVVRGQATSVPIQVDVRGGAFDQPVTLGCANLPAGMTCQFSPATVQPGANGASSTLTIATTANVATHRMPTSWPFGTLLFGTAGIVLVGGKRKRQTLLLTLALIALVLLLQVGCGGGGAGTSAAPSTSTSAPATTVTITVTGTSGGLQHSSAVSVTLH